MLYFTYIEVSVKRLCYIYYKNKDNLPQNYHIYVKTADIFYDAKKHGRIWEFYR